MRGYLSLGSNLGDREKMLESALAGLEDAGLRVISLSDVYETLPVEVGEVQPAYLNMAVGVDFDCDVMELLEICQRIEQDLGRERPYYHAARTMDVDILLVEGVVMASAALTLPHPAMEGRAFVIFPLAQIAPDLILASGRSVREIKKDLKGDEIVDVWTMKWMTRM